MKKVFVIVMLVFTAAVLFTSCAATKRDCQGVKHTKQKGGFYM